MDIVTSHQKTRWLVIFSLDMQTYIRYNYRCRTHVLCKWRKIIICGSMVILHLGVKDVDIRKLAFDTYIQHTDSEIHYVKI